MSESGNYPPGAEHDPRAPYNEVEDEDCTDCEGTGYLFTQQARDELLRAARSGDLKAVLDIVDSLGQEECDRCDGTGRVGPPTKEEIEEARAEARFDQLHEEGRA